MKEMWLCENGSSKNHTTRGTCIDQGRMIRLGDDEETAFQLYHELKASQAPATTSDSVASLLNS